MLKIERRISIITSLILLALIIHYFDLSILISLYLGVIPFFGITVYLVQLREDRREGVRLSISRCMEESDFNVVHGMEMLGNYFSDTLHAGAYLSVVDCRLLIYVFDEQNSNLKYSDYIKGATQCLASFKEFDGLIEYRIKGRKLTDTERVKSLLNILYHVGKQIDSGSDVIKVEAIKKLHLTYKVTGVYTDNSIFDPFGEKLQTILES